MKYTTSNETFTHVKNIFKGCIYGSDWAKDNDGKKLEDRLFVYVILNDCGSLTGTVGSIEAEIKHDKELHLNDEIIDIGYFHETDCDRDSYFYTVGKRFETEDEQKERIAIYQAGQKEEVDRRKRVIKKEKALLKKLNAKYNK